MIHVLSRDLVAARLGLDGICLVAEDDSLIRLDLQDTLSQIGLPRILGAASVANALSMIEQHPVRFGILDYQLCDGTSLPLAQVLIERGVPFIFLTAYGTDVEVPASLSHVPVLSKPFTTALLAEAILVSLTDFPGLVEGSSPVT